MGSYWDDIQRNAPKCPHCGNADHDKIAVKAKHTRINGRSGATWDGSWRCLSCRKTIGQGELIDAPQETNGDAV